MTGFTDAGDLFVWDLPSLCRSVDGSTLPGFVVKALKRLAASSTIEAPLTSGGVAYDVDLWRFNGRSLAGD